MRKTGGSKRKKRLAGHGEGGAGGGGPRRGLNRKRAVSMRGGDVRPSQSDTAWVVRAVSVA